MDKGFKEVFPSLKLDDEMSRLLDNVDVTKISANHERSHVRIYLNAKRLIFKSNIWKLESAIEKQIFVNKNVDVKIIETYQLSEQYTPQTLLDVYLDSILDELNAYSVLEYNLLRTATMDFPEKDKMILTVDNTIIAKTKINEIIEFLEKVICERCGMHLKIQVEYREPGESKYRKNSAMQIRQEVINIVERTSLAKKNDQEPVKEDDTEDMFATQKSSKEKTEKNTDGDKTQSDAKPKQEQKSKQ